MPKFIVRWNAVYETEVEAPNAEEAEEMAADICIDVKGSEYQQDTWEVEKITEKV